MKKLLLLILLSFGSLQICHAEGLKLRTAKVPSQFMKPAIEAKDAPATCWFLGQVHGYALALDNSGDEQGKQLYKFVRNSAGKCGGTNSLNLSETFTPDEWKRLSELRKKIEQFGL